MNRKETDILIKEIRRITKTLKQGAAIEFLHNAGICDKKGIIKKKFR